MNEPKLYLVAVHGMGVSASDYNQFLVVGIHPTEWIVLTSRVFGVLVNFWEITEGAFSNFRNEEQEAAWDEFNELCPEG